MIDWSSPRGSGPFCFLGVQDSPDHLQLTGKDSCSRARQQGEYSTASGGVQPGLCRLEDARPSPAAAVQLSASSVGTKEAEEEEEEEGKRKRGDPAL